MEVKPRIRRFLSWYECEGDEVWMSGSTIQESYENWLKLYKNTQTLKEAHNNVKQITDTQRLEWTKDIQESVTDYRRQYVDQLQSHKENLILDAFAPLVKGDITVYKGRLHCIVNHKGIETYCLDETPVIEIHPLTWNTDYDGIRSWDSGPNLTACYQYRILWKGEAK